jgi:putative Mg2+ transporter-C (MgtC) family protein
VQGKIAAQVVTGVGFLGAGTILRSDRGVQSHGLTTAASIWCTAAIGIALGYGGISIWMAISTSVILFITLTILGWFESIALDKQKHKILNFSVIIPDPSRESNIPGTIVSSLVQSGIHINSMTTDPPDPNSPTRLIHLNINLQGKEDSDAIALLLSSNPLVKEFNWSK